MEIDYNLCTEIMYWKLINHLSSNNLLTKYDKRNNVYELYVKNNYPTKFNITGNEFISIIENENILNISISIIKGMKLRLEDYTSKLYHFTEEIIVNMGC